MEGEIRSLINVWLSVLASLFYCYFIASMIPKGKLRFLSLLPIFYLFTILPLYLISSVLPTGITSFFISWLANFKLLLFCFDMGPLSSDPSKSLLLFISIACLPIKIKQDREYPSLQNHKSPLHLAAKALLFALLISVHDYKESVHPNIVLVLYCCQVFLFVELVLSLCNAMVRALVGLELEQPSDEPYFSTSLQDFWGKRWNLMVTNILRHTVYKPIRSVSAAFLGCRWAPLPAVVVAFLVSGLMHELLFFHVTRVTPTWEVTWFFVLHGVCVVVEVAMKKGLSDKWQLHWAMSGPLTVGFVVVTSSWLFLPPLVRNGADMRAIEECKVLVEFVMGKLK